MSYNRRHCAVRRGHLYHVRGGGGLGAAAYYRAEQKHQSTDEGRVPCSRRFFATIDGFFVVGCATRNSSAGRASLNV